MFAGAAREAVFANPEVIRRVQEEFIPVSVAAAHMQRPSPEVEKQLLHAIGQSGPAPQGISVLNSDGQVLDWALMFRDDPAVLAFLDHTLKRFGEHPDRSEPFDTGRYQQFPDHAREPMPAHDFVLPTKLGHGPDDRCPADAVYLPGTVIAKIAGRRVNDDGTVRVETVNQEDYSQDRFTIEPAMQEEFAEAIVKAEGQRVRVPDRIATQWTAYAYMGMLDVRPLNNPTGLKTERSEIEFWAEPDAENPSWIRLSGNTDVLVGDPVNGAGRARMGNSVQLEWTGYVKVEESRIASLLLFADGEESLRWGMSGQSGQPEVASLPGGRFIQWSGRVRYGIIGEPAKPEQVSETSGSTITGDDKHREIQAKMPRLKQHMEQDGERTRRIIGPLMPEFQRMMGEGRFGEASKHLDKILEQLEGETEGSQ